MGWIDKIFDERNYAVARLAEVERERDAFALNAQNYANDIQQYGKEIDALRVQLQETQQERDELIEDFDTLLQDRDSKKDYAERMDALAEERLIEITALRAELQRTHNRSLASHCHVPGHFSSPVACECKACLDALRARLDRCVEALEAYRNYEHSAWTEGRHHTWKEVDQLLMVALDAVSRG